MSSKYTVVQMLPALESGGVERGTVELGNYLVGKGHRSIVISAGGSMQDMLVQQGSEHVDWSVGKKSLTTLKYISKVRNFLREQKPDILHLRSRLPAWVGYLAWKKLPVHNRPKLVTTVHGPYSVGKYSSVMVRGQRVIAVSEMIRGYILANYPFVDPSHIHVVYRGVDTNEYTFGFTPPDAWKTSWFEQFPQMQGRQLLTLPARLTRWKGQEDFILMIGKLVKSGQAVHGVIVGGAHPRKQGYQNELQLQINKLGLQQEVTIVGHRSDLKEVLAISAIVFSFSTDPEAFGRTTIEALSLGIPVLGYSHGGVKEQLSQVLPEGMIPLGAVDEATLKVKQWLTTPPVPSQQHEFTLDAMCNRTLNVYKELRTNAK